MGVNERLWIEHSFDNQQICFPGCGTWQIKKHISIKERLEEYWMGDTEEDWLPSEVHTVFECVQVEGLNLGKAAILKIRVQIPGSYPPEPYSDDGAKFAQHKELHYSTEGEISNLRKLTEAGCPATSRLLAVRQDTQHEPVLKAGYDDELHWVPGGYVVYILMDKLHGEDLSDFFLPQKFTLQERDEVQEAFREAFTAVEACGIEPMDGRLSNIIWDKTSKRCYLLDFEDASQRDEESLQSRMPVHISGSSVGSLEHVIDFDLQLDDY